MDLCREWTCVRRTRLKRDNSACRHRTGVGPGAHDIDQEVNAATKSLPRRLFARGPKPIVVASEQRHGPVHAEPVYARRRPATRPHEGLPRPLSYQLSPELGCGGQMDRAVEVDVAELIRANVEVHSIDAVWLIETPVDRCLDIRPCGHRIRHRRELAGQCRWRCNWT